MDEDLASHDLPAESRFWGEASFEGFSLLRARYLEQRFSRHSHDTYVIGTNLLGHASCFDDAGPVSPGALVVVPPGEPHAGHRVGDEPWVYLAAYPTAELVNGIAEELTGRPGARPRFDRTLYLDREMVRRFIAAHEAFVRGEDPACAESAMVDFLVELLSRHGHVGRATRADSCSWAVRRAADYIRNHLDDSLTLEELASTTGYSRFHFSRLFKKETGLTPHAFILQQRVERAKVLLKRGASIAGSAFDSGFADQPHLTRRFKQLVGVTPGEFVQGRVAPGSPVCAPLFAARRQQHADRGQQRRQPLGE